MQHASSPPPPRSAAAVSPCSGAGLYGVLRAEAKLARRAIGNAGDEPPPDATGWYGRGRPGPAIKVALLGDSSAAGYGVDRVEETPGALLASGLAEQADRRVHLRCVRQGRRPVLRPGRPDRAGPADRARRRGHPDRRQRRDPHGDAAAVRAPPLRGVRRLRDAGVAVLVGTCPDLGTIKPIAPPLQAGGPLWSRRLAAAQTIAVVEEGGRTGLARLDPRARVRRGARAALRPRPVPPVGRGLRPLVAVLLPSTLAALGLAREEEAQPETFRGEGVLPIAPAAVEPPGRPAPSSTAPRSAAPGAAYAASGSSCGTAAAAPDRGRGPGDRRGPAAGPSAEADDRT